MWKHVKVKPDQVFLKEPEFSQFCYNRDCKYNHMVETLKNSYYQSTGFYNPSQNPEIKNKKKITCLSHYDNWKCFTQYTFGKWLVEHGVENASQLQSVKDKKLQNLINKGYNGWGDYLSKIIKNFCDKLSISNISQLDSVKQKKLNHI